MFGSGLLITAGPSVAVWASLIDRSSAFRPTPTPANNEHLSPQSHKTEHSHQWHISIITEHVVSHHWSGSVERNMSRMSRSGEKVDVNYWHSEKKNPLITLPLKIRRSLCFICSRLKLNWQLEVPVPPTWKLCLLKYHWSGTSYVKSVTSVCKRARKCWVFGFVFFLITTHSFLHLHSHFRPELLIIIVLLSYYPETACLGASSQLSIRIFNQL